MHKGWAEEAKIQVFCELGSVTALLQPTQPLEAVWCYRWVLTPLINSSEDTVHILTFSFPSFPPLFPSVTLPHTFTLRSLLINSPALSRCLNLSLFPHTRSNLSHFCSLVFLYSSLPLCPSTHTLLSLSFDTLTFCCPISVPHCCPSTLWGASVTNTQP